MIIECIMDIPAGLDKIVVEALAGALGLCRENVLPEGMGSNRPSMYCYLIAHCNGFGLIFGIMLLRLRWF